MEKVSLSLHNARTSNSFSMNWRGAIFFKHRMVRKCNLELAPRTRSKRLQKWLENQPMDCHPFLHICCWCPSGTSVWLSAGSAGFQRAGLILSCHCHSWISLRRSNGCLLFRRQGSGIKPWYLGYSLALSHSFPFFCVNFWPIKWEIWYQLISQILLRII